MIRPIEIGDAVWLVVFTQEEKIKEMIKLPSSVEEMATYIKRNQEARKMIRWVIILEDENRIIGSISLKKISQKHKRADIGYRIGKEYEWNWYMTEVIREYLVSIFKESLFERIQAWIRSDNIASIKLVEKFWFICEGKARKYSRKGEKSYDFFLYGLLKEDFH